MKYNLEKMSLLAQGGEADLYEVDEYKILRVVRKNNSAPFENEKIIFPVLIKNNILIPKVYEYIQIGKNQAEVMERINGNTMLDNLMRHPFNIRNQIVQFAKMHQQILSIHGGNNLYSIEEVIEGFRKKPLKVEKEIFDFVIQILRGLPTGDSVCHGDFHPGNILVQGDKKYIIDWSGVHVGNYVSDIAHTYLLMTHVPEIPGQSKILHKIISLAGKYIANLYLKEMHRLLNFDKKEFSKWLVVMTLFRVYFGLPSEQEERKQYLKKQYHKI